MDITKFFKPKNNKVDTKTNKIPNIQKFYFVLVFENSNLKTYFVKKIDKNNYKILDSIKNKNFYEIILAYDLNVYDKINKKKEFNVNVRYNFDKNHLSILKSNLQKSFRRENEDIFMKTCMSFISIKKDGCFELLRRMTIIIVEDGILGYNYDLLIWFMMYLSKNYTLNNFMIKNMMKTLFEFFNNPFKDQSYKLYSNKNNFIKLEEIYNNNNLDQKSKNLLISLKLRNFYNGMFCDNIMIDKIVNIWYKRLLENNFKRFSEILDANKSIISYNRDTLVPNEILLESFDHHCTNISQIILDLCHNTFYLKIKKDKIESVIWDFSSSVNSRLDINKNVDKSLVQRLSKEDADLWFILKNIYLEETNIIRHNRFS